MKILHCLKSLDPAEGAPRDFVELSALAQSRYKYTVEVACLDEKTDSVVRQFPAKVHALGPAKTPYAYSGKLLKWLKKNATTYDVVIVNGIWNFPSVAVWLALRESAVPYFVMPHGQLGSYTAYKTPLDHFAKLIYWNLAQHRVLHNAQAVLFATAEERNQARGAFTPYEFKEEVIGYGTAIPALENEKQKSLFYQSYPALKNKQVLLYQGRLSDKDGCELLIPAFVQIAQENPALYLFITGQNVGGYEQVLFDQWQKVEPSVRDRISLAPTLQGDLHWGALRAADAFIFPSHEDIHGKEILEAMSVGKPVLISKKVSLWMEIAQYEAGLVEDDDVEGVATLMRRWIDTPYEERRTLEDNARTFFTKRFDDQKFFKKYLSVLQSNQSSNN